jgi:hypothetical protein
MVRVALFLHLEAVEPSRASTLASFRCVPALPLDLNVTKRAECEARHTSKCFCAFARHGHNVILCGAGGC